MVDSSGGQNLVVENSLGMVLEEEGVTIINSPCLGASSIILTDNSSSGELNVSHYIIPQEVTVAGFEEVVEEVELASSWDSITSSSSAGSLGQDSGIESDANQDVFFAFVDDSVSPMTLLTSVSTQERGGEVIVQKMYEMKEDLVLTNENGLNAKETFNKIKVIPHQIVKVLIKEESLKQRVNKEKDVFKIIEKEREIFKEDYKDEIIFKDEPMFSEDEFLQDLKKCHSEEDKETDVEIDSSKTRTSAKQQMYHCTECDTNFTSHKNFKNHLEDHLIRLQNSCALCNREFKSKSLLQDHIKEHFTKSASVPCEICKKEFMSKTILKRHRKQMHSSNNGQIVSPSLKCDVCQSVFSSKFSLKSHSATHSTRKPYTCKECGATFTQNGSLQVHLRRHRGEKPFKCVICGNNFTRAHSLKVHMKTHTGEKPYTCEYCGACFVTSSHLTVHRRTHTGERPYSCNSCGATFITTSHLNVHRRLHNSNSINSTSKTTSTSPKSVACSLCGSTFDDPGKLRHHRRAEHKGVQRSNATTKCKVKDKGLVGSSQVRSQITNGCD